MNRKLIAGVIVTTALCSLGAPARAALIGHDGFAYPDAADIVGSGGGVGWQWNNFDQAQTNSISAWEGSFGNHASVSAGRAWTQDGSSLRNYGGERDNGAVRATGQVYYSAFMTWSAGATWGGLSPMDYGNEFVKFGVVERDGKRYFGIELNGGWGGVDSNIEVLAGQTYHLVGLVDYQNDKLRLWIDPALGDEGSPDLSRDYFDGNWTTSVRIGSGGSTAVAWDEVRVGNDWASVAVPEPAAIGLSGLVGLLLWPRRRGR